jgi:acyl-CoA hydrolase
MPRTFGDGMVHESHFDALVYADFPLPESSYSELSQEERKIGEIIATNLVEDSATLQFGIGNLPQAIVPLLSGHRDLGVHTEQFTDSVIDLIEQGVVTNARKNVFPGKVVATFCLGTQKLYDYVHDNPLFMMCDVEFTNDQQVIRENPKVTSVNSCIEVDITGQVVSDSIGTSFYSGFGGQIDFVRGATLCNDGKGKAIIAMSSLAGNGESKIVPTIRKGAGVVTTRAHVNYIVTEYGIAHLFGKNFRQRAYHLIRIAHPDHREALEKEAFDRLGCMPTPD